MIRFAASLGSLAALVWLAAGFAPARGEERFLAPETIAALIEAGGRDPARMTMPGSPDPRTLMVFRGTPRLDVVAFDGSADFLPKAQAMAQSLLWALPPATDTPAPAPLVLAVGSGLFGKMATEEGVRSLFRDRLPPAVDKALAARARVARSCFGTNFYAGRDIGLAVIVVDTTAGEGDMTDCLYPQLLYALGLYPGPDFIALKKPFTAQQNYLLDRVALYWLYRLRRSGYETLPDHEGLVRRLAE